VAFIPLETVRVLTREFPDIVKALLRLSAVEAAISRQWLLNVGQRSAFAALAHLFCELFVRLRAAGLAHEHTCQLPLTQTDLADALALTPVHLNRTLMKMRKTGIATLTGGKLCILQAEALRAAAKFNPGYLGAPDEIPLHAAPLAAEPLPAAPESRGPVDSTPRHLRHSELRPAASSATQDAARHHR
jgi:hypothetical protein